MGAIFGCARGNFQVNRGLFSHILQTQNAINVYACSGEGLGQNSGHKSGERKWFHERDCVHPMLLFLRDRPDTSTALNLTVAAVPFIILEFGLMQL